MPLISTSDLAVNYGEISIFADISLEVHEHARIGIVGPNGGGKTSLVKVLVEELEPSAGTVQRSRGLRVGYVPQVAPYAPTGTLKDEVMGAFQRLRWLEQALETSAQDLKHAQAEQATKAQDTYAALLQEYESLDGYTSGSALERMVDGLGLSEEILNIQASKVSGGERTRAALARALLGDPDLLVLDEPTNYLDLKGLTWLERYLTHFGHAILVVSHDRYFLDRTVNQIWELDHGRLDTYRGNYSRYRALKAERLLTQRREYEKQQEYIAKEEAFIQRYHAGQRSREARGRATRLERLERVGRPEHDRPISILSANADRTEQVVVATHNLKVGFIQDEGSTRLLSVPDIKLERGSCTAIIGDNGAGKTTLLRTILGLTPPVEGSVDLGTKVKVGYYRQGRDDLPEDSTVLEALLDTK
ncbi:MAG: ABC-F family ATP-binding cassette domain-containing protein, partial [Dehalococcoidia bacterium]